MFVCEIVTSEGQPMGIKNKCGCYGIINILHGWNLICCKQWKDMAGFFSGSPSLTQQIKDGQVHFVSWSMKSRNY